MTGRENVFLNGAILGYARADIAARFERIVNFAGVRDFTDAPLRTCSSGMVVRLAFALATDVQPEIWIVDEVMAVGDAEFQAKSFDRIQGFRAGGTTILMASHNLGAVQKMCERAVWLDHGVVRVIGPAEEVVAHYRTQSLKAAQTAS